MKEKKFNYSDLTKGKYKITSLSLLTTNSLKTIKGLDHGILSGILYLSPHKSGGAKLESGETVNVCPSASSACIAACLYRSGAALIYSNVNKARRRKTKEFVSDTPAFMAELAADIGTIERAAKRRDMIPAIRLNGTSDLRWERIPVSLEGRRYHNIMEAFPKVSFYDYTKREDRFELPPNYSLTFSRSGENDSACFRALERGINVAIVFYGELPASYWGYPVVNGELFDARFKDPSPAIVGLKAKAHAKKDRSAFVVREHALACQSPELERIAV